MLLTRCYVRLSVQVGKNNIWSTEHMAAASACSPFRLVAADYQPLEWTLKRLGDLTERMSMGNGVQPLPLTSFCFETAEMIRAFNELRRGDHVGRYVASIAAKLAFKATQPAGCHPAARIL